ncbi:SRPBCC family protein [Paludisphaera rhizosphaerae]|uniref:SRPBCC family protein n=1 Tax=Paludisphaera rhizosphaerae TaxID=2711216 RepID=UPI0013ECE26E|nr:SRPBCC family protein [Paludisphaera rhizosphaerae]
MTTFTTKREIPAIPSAVFAAFRDPVRLARWWGPDGFTNTFETFEFQPGGRWVFVMHGPTGANYDNESRFETIVPDEQVVIRHVSQPHFRLTVTLQEQPAGTLLLWEQAFDDDDVAKAVRHIVEPANEQNLDRLSAEVQAG